MHSLCTKIGILPERQCKDTTSPMRKYPHGSASFRKVQICSAFVFHSSRRGTPTLIITHHPLHRGVRGVLLFSILFFSISFLRAYARGNRMYLLCFQQFLSSLRFLNLCTKSLLSYHIRARFCCFRGRKCHFVAHF